MRFSLQTPSINGQKRAKSDTTATLRDDQPEQSKLSLSPYSGRISTCTDHYAPQHNNEDYCDLIASCAGLHQVRRYAQLPERFGGAGVLHELGAEPG